MTRVAWEQMERVALEALRKSMFAPVAVGCYSHFRTIQFSPHGDSRTKEEGPMGHMPLHRDATVSNPWRLGTSSRLTSVVGRQCERFAELGSRLTKPCPSAKLAPVAA